MLDREPAYSGPPVIMITGMAEVSGCDRNSFSKSNPFPPAMFTSLKMRPGRWANAAASPSDAIRRPRKRHSPAAAAS